MEETDKITDGEDETKVHQFSRYITLSEDVVRDADCGMEEGGILAPRGFIDRLVYHLWYGEPYPEPEPTPEVDDEPTAPAPGMKRYLVTYKRNTGDYMDDQIDKYWLYPEQVETINKALEILSKTSIDLTIEEIVG